MRVLLTSFAIVCIASLGVAAAAEPLDPFDGYKGKEPVPDGLRKAYTAFASQVKDGGVESFLLPHSVTIGREMRPEKTREYGQEINVAFLKSGFTPQVMLVRKDPDDCYLIRTSSSAIWFVQNKSGAWKIYRYLDKPIE